MEQHWSPEEVRNAEEWIEDAVCDISESIHTLFSYWSTDAGTSESTKKIRPGHKLDIVLYASSCASVR